MLFALYRKYRPQNFSELVGQNHIKVTLQNEIEKGRVAHAYLFSGPRGIGKTTTARLLAKAINCEKQREAEPCNKCVFCKEISEGRSMDLIEIDAASHTGVDNVRENIIENARFTPLRAKYKVFIIDEVHMLSLSAFNALLKTLEEPPEHVVFILATTEIYRVPETIISRCQRFDFKKVNIGDLVGRLQFVADKEEVKIESQILKNIALRAEGSVRDAEVLLAQILALGEKNITKEQADLVMPRSDIKLVVEFVGYLSRNDISSAIALVNKLIDQGVNLSEFMRDLIEFLRKMLLIKIGGSLDEYSAIELDEEDNKKILIISDDFKIQELSRVIEIFLEKFEEIRYAQLLPLPLELAIVKICAEKQEERENKNIGMIGQKTEGKKAVSSLKSEQTKARKKDEPNQKSDDSFTKIQKIWPEFLAKLGKHNHSLALILKVGVPIEIKDDFLIIGFKFEFHQERVKEKKNFDIIEKVLKEITNEKIKIKAKVISEKEYEALANQANLVYKLGRDDGLAGRVLEEFGGQIIS